MFFSFDQFGGSWGSDWLLEAPSSSQTAAFRLWSFLFCLFNLFNKLSSKHNESFSEMSPDFICCLKTNQGIFTQLIIKLNKVVSSVMWHHKLWEMSNRWLFSFIIWLQRQKTSFSFSKGAARLKIQLCLLTFWKLRPLLLAASANNSWVNQLTVSEAAETSAGSVSSHSFFDYIYVIH